MVFTWLKFAICDWITFLTHMRMLYFIWRTLAAFCFLLMTYYFFSLHNGDVRQKQIRQIFLSEFKMGPKATETPCNMNNGFGPGTADEPGKGYIKAWRVLKMRSDHQGQSSHDYTGSCQRTQHGGLNSCSALGSKLKGERLDNWRKIKKIILNCLLFIGWETMNHFLVRLWQCDKRTVSDSY